MKTNFCFNKYTSLIYAVFICACIVVAGLLNTYIVGLIVFSQIAGNLLLGGAAIYAAWWTRKTFAFKEKIHTYEKTISILNDAQQAFMRRYGAEYKLQNTLVSAGTNGDIDVSANLRRMSEIEIEHKVATEALNNLHDSFFVSSNFRAKLLLNIQAASFTDSSQVQAAFMKLKSELRKDYGI